MNDITIFNHLGNDIRVMTDEQGEPLFVLKDICDALEIGNPREVVRRLDGDCVSQTDVTDNLGRNQKANVITERAPTKSSSCPASPKLRRSSVG